MKNLSEIIDQSIGGFDQISTSEWDLKPSADKWSKKEILGHLVDSARNNLQRFTEIQYFASPYRVVPYHQDHLVVANSYQAEPLDLILGLWVSLNRHIDYIMKIQNQETLTRPVILVDNTEADLQFLMDDYVDHLQHHLRQILR